MDDDIKMRRLVEMLTKFFTENISVEEDSTCSLTSEFLQNVQDLLFTKQMVAFLRWQSFYNANQDRIMSSPETYLKFLFHACQTDDKMHRIVFEKCLHAFALILRVSIETLQATKVNFCKLVPDAFMGLYQKEYKNAFSRRGGFDRFVEHVNNPDFLDTNCIARNICNSYDPNSSASDISKDVYRKVMKIVNKKGERLPPTTNFAEVDSNQFASRLAKKVLETTRAELLASSSEGNSEATVVKYTDEQLAVLSEEWIRKLEKAKKEGGLNETLNKCPGSDSGSKTDCDISGQIAYDEGYENIIEAVICHNRSESSNHTKCDGLTKADGILKHLKSKIESLIDVLDECDQE